MNNKKVLSYLTNANKCWMCDKEFDEPLMGEDDKVNGYFAFHMKSTHGIPPEALVSIMWSFGDE